MAAPVDPTPKREPMVMVKELCIDCAVCREVCPYTAVFFVPTKWKIALQVDQVRCTGCGGPELLRRLQVQVPALKVLYMSGYTSDTIVRHGVLEAQVAFLNKPFTDRQLNEAIADLMQ